MEPIEKTNPVYSNTESSKVKLTDAEWKNILSPGVYHIARNKGTEMPWSSQFENFKKRGTYYCAACGNALFQSDTKFESGCRSTSSCGMRRPRSASARPLETRSMT